MSQDRTARTLRLDAEPRALEAYERAVISVKLTEIR